LLGGTLSQTFKTFKTKKKNGKSSIRVIRLWKKEARSTLIGIAGINAHICDKCIEQAHGIVLEELNPAKFKTG
jgi:hypothetical protein